MKHLLSILLISSICLTQEMEVEGDLKVTGNIQNQMIDNEDYTERIEFGMWGYSMGTPPFLMNFTFLVTAQFPN